MPHSLNKSLEHWEQDRWDDHPTFGVSPNVELAFAHQFEQQQQQQQQSVHVSEKQEHLNIFQKLLYFLAHPIKTLSKSESGMHGSMSRHASHPSSAFAGLPSHSQTPTAWWESRYTDTDWSR